MRRRHQVLLARLALGLLALIAELIGRSLTHRVNIGRHVATPSYSGADYYPILLIVVKAGASLMLARVAWRFARARSAAATARRLLVAHGHRPMRRAPRVHLRLSARLWLSSFLVTASIFLVQADAERLSSDRWPLLAPWLHTSALPVFAVLAVLVALVYRAFELWLSEYESYARETAAFASRICAQTELSLDSAQRDEISPRALFGLVFDCRPPPLAA